MDQTDTSAQDEDGNSSDQDTQLASGPNYVVDNKGPVQLGIGSTVHSPVYKDCNIHHHHHYPPPHPGPHDDTRLVEQTAAGLPPCSGHHLQDQTSRNEDTKDRKTSSHHVPCHFRDCLHYHHNYRPPLRPPHHPVPQPPSSQQTQHTESTERSEPSTSGRYGQTSESVETRRESSEGVRDSVCILDFKDRALEPGDAIWMGSQLGTWAVYVGNREVVFCRGRDMMVVKEELAMTDPFGKFKVKSGRCSVYPPAVRVDRATAMIGRKYREGDMSYETDFLYSVFTGLGRKEALIDCFSLVW